MRLVRIIIVVAIGVILAASLFVFISLRLWKQPNYIQNFEAEEFKSDVEFIEPLLIHNELAIYERGKGEPILLFPYPHAHTTSPMIQGELANVFVNLGRRVISFDVPGAYRSTRKPTGKMSEMLDCAEEVLNALGINETIDIAGHSMGSLCALAFTIEKPARVRRLILVGSMSGFPAAARHGLPGSVWKPTDIEYWQLIFWGLRLTYGRENLALHKRYYNMMSRVRDVEQDYFIPLSIDEDDQQQGVPIRSIWSKNFWRKVDYSKKLNQIKIPTFIGVGRYDPETPLACSEELVMNISEAQLVIFEKSGHRPFVEEIEAFADVLRSFLSGKGGEKL